MKMKGFVKNRVTFFGLFLFISLFVFISSASAVSPVVSERPDWWDAADARVIFDFGQFPGFGIGDGIADGTAGFAYDYHHSYFSRYKEGVFDLFLDNYNDPSKVKNVWMAYHYVGDVINDTDFSITGYVGGQSIDASIINVDTSYSGWLFIDARIVPQPDEESFTVFYSSLNGAHIDYFEVATQCVPIPSALMLFGGGLAGLAGLRRRRQN